MRPHRAVTEWVDALRRRLASDSTAAAVGAGSGGGGGGGGGSDTVGAYSSSLFRTT